MIQKFICKCKVPRLAKTILKKSKVGRFVLFFKSYYKATVINTVWYSHKDTQINQKNRIQNPKIDTVIYDQIDIWQRFKDTLV